MSLPGLYTEFFRFPFLIYVPGSRSFVLSGAPGMATVIPGALRAVWGSVRLTPAVAMSPPTPAQFRRGWGSVLGRALRLRQTALERIAFEQVHLFKGNTQHN